MVKNNMLVKLKKEKGGSAAGGGSQAVNFCLKYLYPILDLATCISGSAPCLGGFS
jgi:hypothetical protein